MKPEGPQISALNALARTREDGMDRAIVVAATGVGKTFIAAKDSVGFRKVLFVAHRREILEQAEATFRKVRPNDRAGFLYSGVCDLEADMLFASVQSLRNKDVLDSLDPERFDYMVIDEFHHAVSGSYADIIDHFRPKFMLGLTATPERMDRQDVFALCDYNVPYEIGLSDAIRYGRLVPFTYLGISDETDYGSVAYRNGHYSQSDLDRVLSNDRRAELIFKHYMKHRSARAIGFCSGIEHAVFMRDYFRSRGISANAVVSGGEDDRRASVEDFEDGKVSVLFTVDMFNEGVDIPSIDTVMFLRPTESQTVFTQQLGRGLRRCEGKDRLTVLDFIGNYRNVDHIPALLTGDPKVGLDPRKISDRAPCDCIIDFDLTAVDVMKRVAERKKNARALVDEAFDRVMEGLGHIPTRVELLLNLDSELYSYARSKEGPLKDYIGYLQSRGLASPSESTLLGNTGGDFVRMVETTSMSKLYKMPLLLSLFRDGRMVLRADDTDIAESFRTFYENPSNRTDIADIKGMKPYEQMNNDDWVSLARRNPVKFFRKSSPEFFPQTETGFELCGDLEHCLDSRDFNRHVLDAIHFRVIDFKRRRYQERNRDGEAGERQNSGHNKS